MFKLYFDEMGCVRAGVCLCGWVGVGVTEESREGGGEREREGGIDIKRDLVSCVNAHLISSYSYSK